MQTNNAQENPERLQKINSYFDSLSKLVDESDKSMFLGLFPQSITQIFNVIPDSEVQSDADKKMQSIIDNYNRESPDNSKQALEELVDLLLENKKQTDKLYDFVVDAKSKNNGKEFTNEEDFKKFLESNNTDLAKLGSTKELMQISNAFIKINPQPEDFNRFIDKFLETTNPIMQFIKTILDKMKCVSLAEKIGQNITKNVNTTMNKAIEQSSDIQQKNQNSSIQM